MDAELAGSFYSVATAATWAVAVILFKRSGESIDPVALNVLKGTVALGLMIVTFVAMDELPTRAPAAEMWTLALSGAIGIGFADTLFFVSLNILGASRHAIIECAYSPAIVLVAFLLLGERLAWVDGVGAVLIVGAMLLVVARRSHGDLPASRMWLGVGTGVLAVVSMGLSIVWVKPLLASYDVLFATMVRLAGGLAALAPVVLFHPASRRRALRAFQPQRAWRYAVPGAIMGNYVSLLLWIAGFKYAPASVAAILNQTSTVFTVLLAAIFLAEPIDRRRAVAVALAVTGSVLVIL